MDYTELAYEVLQVTHPRGRKPTLNHMEKLDRMRDMTLRYLQDHGGEASPRELTEAFGVSSARVTKLLGDLEEQGLVVRQCDRQDRRRIIVRLTSAGEQTAQQHSREVIEHLAQVLEALGPEDAVELVRLFRRLVEIVEPGNCPGAGRSE